MYTRYTLEATFALLTYDKLVLENTKYNVANNIVMWKITNPMHFLVASIASMMDAPDILFIQINLSNCFNLYSLDKG